MTSPLIPVPFHGDTLYLVEHDGEPYTPVKPFCQYLGLAWEAQRTKLAAKPKRWGMMMIVIPSPGGLQETACLPLRKLPGWVQTIDVAKTKPEARAKLELIQEEGDEVLWRHWAGQMAPKPVMIADPLPPTPKTVTLTENEYRALQDEMRGMEKEMLGLYRAKVEFLELQMQHRERRNLDDDEKARIKELRAQGLGPTAIGKMVGRSPDTVETYLRRVRLGAEG